MIFYYNCEVGKTHDHYKLSIFKSPAAKPRLFCPNDFFVLIFGKYDENFPRQIAWAEVYDGTVRDSFGKGGTLVFVKWRKELDQLRAQGRVRRGFAWEDFW